MIWSSIYFLLFGMQHSASTQQSRVTFASELFQLRLLCCLLQLFLISQSIPLLSRSQRLRMDNPQPPSITTPMLHTDTHVKTETRTTTGVYTRLSVHTGFRVIYEVRKEIKHDRLHCV